MPEQRTTRDKCRVCGKQGPQYTEIRENDEWYPSEDTPDDWKFYICSPGCWEARLANILRKCDERRERRGSSSGGIDRNGFRILDGGKNEGRRDGRESMKGCKRR